MRQNQAAHHAPSGAPPKAVRTVGAILLLAVTASCATRPPVLPEPLRAPKPAPAQDEVLRESDRSDRVRIEEGPTLGTPATAKPVEESDAIPPIATKKPVTLALDGVPMASFINVVFGTELGFGLDIDASVRARPDLISLRLTQPQAPEKLYQVAREILRNYGVRVRPTGALLRFEPIADPKSSAVIATRSLPDVPAGQRTVFVAMPLEVAEPGQIANQVRNILGSNPVTITELPAAGALLLSGPGDSVQSAMNAVLALDRAALINKRSIRINPLYVPADLLARELREVLTAQGFSIRSGPNTGGVLTFVPVDSANALLIFSESEPALKAAEQWAEKLDQPTSNGGAGGVFMYSARYTTVQTLLPVLQALVGQAPSASGRESAAPPAAPAQIGPMDGASRPVRAVSSAANTQVQGLTGLGGQIAVDPIRNAIVFQGDAERWRALQGILARLDQPARQVMIEVTVAEVTLTDEFSHGIEWALRNISVDGMSGPLTALGGGGASTGGLVWRALSSSGQVRALVNLFARDSRVTILSTPRIMVKSGESASIDVGTEVPIVTQQATAADLPATGNQSSILQSIQYRKTGVLLELEAVVHSGQRVDLKLAQEVSEATPTDTSSISSPSIFSRRLQTSLSLSDGESMLLGGLISSSRTDGKTKVPLLGDIPVVGTLFQNRRREGNRTELLMLITPYVIEDEAQAREITDTIRSRFGQAK